MIRVLIVDDEEPARSKLRTLLSADGDMEIVGEAADGEAAIEAIRDLAPDLVLLDVQMPKGDGFEVVRQVGLAAMPLTIFVTAFDQHAVDAFEVEAIDYLLKPFARGRLDRALRRAKTRFSQQAEPSDQEARLRRLLAEDAARPGTLEHLLVKRGPHREVMLAVDDVDIFRAEGDQVLLVTAEGSYRCRGPLAKLEQRLDAKRFLRANRGEIVRLAAAREFQPWFRGDYRIIMTNGEVLSWSRRYRAKRKHEFGLGGPSSRSL